MNVKDKGAEEQGRAPGLYDGQQQRLEQERQLNREEDKDRERKSGRDENKKR